MLSVPFSIPFAKCHMHCVAEVFANLPADILPNADDMAGCPHLYNLTVAGDTVKRGMDGQPALAEKRLYVKRNLHVGGVHVFVLQDDCIKFQKFRHFVHVCVV